MSCCLRAGFDVTFVRHKCADLDTIPIAIASPAVQFNPASMRSRAGYGAATVLRDLTEASRFNSIHVPKIAPIREDGLELLGAETLNEIKHNRQSLSRADP